MRAPYVHQEYPKWIARPDGARTIVHDEDEERRELGVEEIQTRKGGWPKGKPRKPRDDGESEDD